jgi:hypothetical protein
VTAGAPRELLRSIVDLLDSIGIAYMVVGSFVSSTYGEPRSTFDLDLVIDPTREQLDQFLSRLSKERYYVDDDVARDALHRRAMFNIIEMESAWKLDLIIRQARPFSIEELRRRRRISIIGVDVAAATPEDTIIAKLEWSKLSSSDRQLDDVAGILRVGGAELDLEYLERWVDTLELRDAWARAQAKA